MRINITKRLIAGIGILMLLSGCASYFNETKYTDVTGAYQLTDRKAFEEINLGYLLCQYSSQGNTSNISECNAFLDPPKPIYPSDSVSNNISEQKQLDEALRYYNNHIVTLNGLQKKTSRNGLQERLLAASAQRCNAYKGNLQRTFSRTNFDLGVLSTIAGSAGAIVTSAGAANSWSALSAIFSGTRSEFNQDYMSNLAAYVIVDGIDKRRQAVYEQIQNQGQSKNYEDYPIEAAIKDALYYHGQCGVIAGFQEASDSIKYVNDPGVDTAIKSLAKIKAANILMMQTNNTEPTGGIDALIANIGKITSTTPLVAGSVLGANKGAAQAPNDFPTTVSQIAAINNQLKQKHDDLVTQAKANDVLNKALNALGLGTAPEITPPLFPSYLRTNCINKIFDYSNKESVAIQNASLITDTTSKAAPLAEADLNKTRKIEIVSATQKLVDDYQSQTNKTITNWQANFDAANVKDAPQASITTFKDSLTNMPQLNPDQKAGLDALCKP